MHRLTLTAAVLALPLAVAAQTAPQQPQPTSAPSVIQPTELGSALQPPQTTTTQTTTGRGWLGEHLQDATPQHPLEMQEEFGECVSSMAVTNDCPMM